MLTGDALADQCRIYRGENDAGACRYLVGLGWAGLKKADSGSFLVLSTVLAYPDDDAASRAYAGLVAAIRREIPDVKAIPGTLADQTTSWGLPNSTMIAYREGPIVAETIVWDGGFGVTEDERRAMAVKWPRVQLSKIDTALGRS